MSGDRWAVGGGQLYPEPIERTRIIRAAAGEDGAAWAAEVGAGAWRQGARAFKREGGTEVVRARVRGREVVIKTWALGWREKLLALAGGTRGVRHWRGARWLEENGFGTARVIALVRWRTKGLKDKGTKARGDRGTAGLNEALVMEALEGKTLLRHLADGGLPVRREHDVARALGAQVGAMVLRGRFNRDHKPSNLIVSEDSDRASDGGGRDAGQARVCVIDCVAIRRWGRGAERRDRATARMLASLTIEPMGVGCRPRRALMLRAVRAAAERLAEEPGRARDLSKGLWARARRLIETHGDPTPRVDPLA